MNRRFLTVEELSEWLNCSPSTVYSYTSKGAIPFVKLNGLLRFDRQEIEEWINRKKEETKRKKKQFSINKNIIERDQIELIVNDAIDSESSYV